MNATRKCGWLLLAACALAWPAPGGEVADVPEAKGYEVIYKLNPAKWKSGGYQVNRSDALSGTLKRVGYFLSLTGKDGTNTWTFVSMDAFSQDLKDVGVPPRGGKVFQDYVDNLEVAGNSDNVKNGKFEKGNIEFWCWNYGQGNAKKIEGASDKTFDFGDSVSVNNGNYGSMQVHNFAEKQTVFSFSRHNDDNPDLGIGNNPTGNPDWTFSQSAKNVQSAELVVLGLFEDLKVLTLLDVDKAALAVDTDKNPVTYAPGEEMTFTFKPDFKGQAPEADYFLQITRTGDDGKEARAREKLAAGEPIVFKTSIDRPGFVRVIATVVDKNDKPVLGAKNNRLQFDGGAGASPEKLEGAGEPADFDDFWKKQKARLAAVPLKHTMEKLPNSTEKVEVYAVSVDCEGPRPVTGYLTIPAGAAEKSLPATAHYQGYGIRVQTPPNNPTDTGRINFFVNAHGYDLGKDKPYYDEFFKGIRSNDKAYAFDPEQNADAEQAYFNGMALRVLRSLEFLKSLPQWDGKNLHASGGSQGGLQTLWAAGLDSDVTRARADVPWCCDLSGKALNKRLQGGWHIQWTDALGYYDAANHAKRVTCMTEIPRAGLGDYVCPPSGIAVAYNNLKSPKKITWFQNSTHGTTVSAELAGRYVLEAEARK